MGPTGAPIMDLAFLGWRIEIGMSRDRLLMRGAGLPDMLIVLLSLTIYHTRALVVGSDMLGGSCVNTNQESRSMSILTRTGHVTPPRKRLTTGITVTPCPAETAMLLF